MFNINFDYKKETHAKQACVKIGRKGKLLNFNNITVNADKFIPANQSFHPVLSGSKF